MAGTVYQWTDTAGVTHFSDSAPLNPAAHSQRLETAPVQATSVQGLRTGERAALQVIDKRIQQQHRAAQATRRRNDRAVAEHRRDCRERRDRQRNAEDRAARKALTAFLRRNCW